MTLNEIIQRDLALAGGMTMEQYDREIKRRLWRKRMRMILEFVSGILIYALMAVFMWACMACSGYHWE